MNKRIFALLAALMFGFVLVGCEEEGPMERAGESVDEAVEEAGDNIEEAGEEVADEIDDATDG